MRHRDIERHREGGIERGRNREREGGGEIGEKERERERESDLWRRINGLSRSAILAPSYIKFVR